MRSTIAYSQEEANDINTIYVSELGRPVDANGLASFQSQIANSLSLVAVNNAVATSPESTADIATVYVGLYGSGPSASELQGDQAFIAAPGQSQSLLFQYLTSTVATILSFVIPSASAAPVGRLNYDVNYIIQHEHGVQPTTYIPTDKKGVVVGVSGVTIGAGVDLGGQSVDGLKNLVANYGLDPAVEVELEKYVGIKGQAALAFIAPQTGNQLTLTTPQLVSLDNAFFGSISSSIAASFNAPEMYGKYTFDKLPGNTQTVIVDMAYHYGPSTKGIQATNFWKQVISGQWKAAFANLMNYGDKTAGSVARNQANAILLNNDIQAGTLPIVPGGSPNYHPLDIISLQV